MVKVFCDLCDKDMEHVSDYPVIPQPQLANGSKVNCCTTCMDILCGIDKPLIKEYRETIDKANKEYIDKLRSYIRLVKNKKIEG